MIGMFFFALLKLCPSIAEERETAFCTERLFDVFDSFFIY